MRGTDEVRIRPSLRTYGRTLRAPVQLLSLVPLALVLAVLVGSGDGAFALALLGGAVLVGALPLVVWVLVARVWTTDRAVHRRGPLGRTRVVARADVASVLWLPGYHRSGHPRTGLLVLLDGRRRPLLRLEGLWWGTEELAALAPAVGAPVAVVDSDLTPGRLAWRNPYDLPARHRHPVVLELAVALAVLAVCVAALLLADAVGWL